MSSDTDGAAGLPSRVHVVHPDVDDYRGASRCSICGDLPETVGTPRIPIEMIADDKLVNALVDRGDDRIPVFGRRCTNHRHETIIPSPPVLAPDSFVPVDVVIDGEITTASAPEPVLPDDYPTEPDTTELTA